MMLNMNKIQCKHKMRLCNGKYCEIIGTGKNSKLKSIALRDIETHCINQNTHHWSGWVSINWKWPASTKAFGKYVGSVVARASGRLCVRSSFQSQFQHKEIVSFRWNGNKIMELFRNYFSMTKAVVDGLMVCDWWLLTCESNFWPLVVGIYTMRIMCRIQCGPLRAWDWNRQTFQIFHLRAFCACTTE